MENFFQRFRLFEISLFIFCGFPLLIHLKVKAIAAIVFVLIQVILIIYGYRSKKADGALLPTIMVLPFFILTFSLLYSDNLLDGVKTMERFTLILLVPWLFYFNRAYITENTVKLVTLYFSVILSILTFITLYKLAGNAIFWNVIGMENSYYYLKERVESISGLHPTYYSLYLAICIVSIVHFYIIDPKKHYKTPFIILIIILVLGLIAASSKMLIIATFISVIYILWNGLSNIKSFIKVLSLITIFMVATFLTIKPTRQRFTEFYSVVSSTAIDETKPDGMRRVIFKSTWKAIAKNYLFGTGLGDEQEELNRVYKNNDYEEAYHKEYNTHNQYLNFLLIAGIPALVALIFMLGAHFIIAETTKDHLYIAIMILFVFSMLSENILNRQDGIFVYAFFTALLPFAALKNRRYKFEKKENILSRMFLK